MNAEPVTVRVPGDKSISHRAFMLAALADGDSLLTGLLDAADTRATAAVLRRLGVDIREGPPGQARVKGAGTGGLTAPAEELDCANSGTTARLMLGVLAGCPFGATLTGDDSLRNRPMRRVTAPLAAAGAAFQELVGPDRLPITVRGRRPLSPVVWRSDVASAQVKSALLLAGVTGAVPVEVREPGPSRDHTERMLRAMGARVETQPDGDGRVVVLEPPDRLEPLRVRVPGDISAATFFFALGALAGPIHVPDVGLNPGRTGALGVLERMGATVAVNGAVETAGEPVGQVVVSPGSLQGTRVEPDEVPALIDEIPILAALAARAEGETRFDGVAELRVKESDRIAVMSENLRRVGVRTETGPDHLVVMGTRTPLAGVVHSHGDHRIAMAFGILGALEGNTIEVRGADAVDVSFPGFWDTLQRVRKELRHR